MTAEQEIRSALEATTGTVQAQGYTVSFAEHASLLSELTSLREERDRLREELKAASDQLAKVHDSAFRQAGGYGLVTGDGRGFSCFELNRCQEIASRARALIQETSK